MKKKKKPYFCAKQMHLIKVQPMQININNTDVQTIEGETLLETARRTGYSIPSLCYAKNAIHKASCMVCVVKDCSSGQIIPSCTTYPTDGMQFDTESDEVLMIRSLSLELLLSDHRADCEAPCSMVCPYGLEIEKMLELYDMDMHEEALALIATSFSFPALGCDNCKAPCEKICRRGSVDQQVAIRAIIRAIVKMYESTAINTETEIRKTDKSQFQSRLGRFTETEKNMLRDTENQKSILNLIQDKIQNSSRCLHCACAGREGCKLRLYATAAGIKRTRYEMSSALPVMKKIHVNGDMWFEPAKCIRCGLCVYNSNNGFTFRDRGFGVQVIIPDENRQNVNKELVDLCPTGALYVKNSCGPCRS